MVNTTSGSIFEFSFQNYLISMKNIKRPAGRHGCNQPKKTMFTQQPVVVDDLC
jgi:hypothetical protein